MGDAHEPAVWHGQRDIPVHHHPHPLPPHGTEGKLVISFYKNHLGAARRQPFETFPQTLEFAPKVAAHPKAKVEDVAIEDKVFHLAANAPLNQVLQQNGSAVIGVAKMDI